MFEGDIDLAEKKSFIEVCIQEMYDDGTKEEEEAKAAAAAKDGKVKDSEGGRERESDYLCYDSLSLIN